MSINFISNLKLHKMKDLLTDFRVCSQKFRIVLSNTCAVDMLKIHDISTDQWKDL